MYNGTGDHGLGNIGAARNYWSASPLAGFREAAAVFFLETRSGEEVCLKRSRGSSSTTWWPNPKLEVTGGTGRHQQ